MSSALIVNQKEQLRELLDSTTNIGIIVGEKQNIDTIAAALGLYLILAKNGKNVQVVSKKDPIVEFSNLVGIDKITKSFEGATKILTISVPYREGEIEKVSYNIEDDRLNVNLFAEGAGIMLNERDIKYLRKGSTPALIITIGVTNEAEIESLLDKSLVKTISIDKNPTSSVTGDIAIVDHAFSSMSEIVAQMIIELSLGYDLDSFQNLMEGITYATRNFTLQDTSPYAFEAAGFLMQNGARRKGKSLPENRPDKAKIFPSEEYFFKTGNDKKEEDLEPEIVEKPTVEELGNLTSGDVPDDWFLPKVFKGSKKGN